jgi:RNA polymerase-binding transcription factor
VRVARRVERRPPADYSCVVDQDRASNLLEARRAEIERALARRSEREDLGADPTDPADVAEQLVDAEVGEGVVEQLRDELAAIERAERRLAEGTYGVSVESGEPIPDARLERIPWAERTAEEQARFGG